MVEQLDSGRKSLYNTRHYALHSDAFDKRLATVCNRQSETVSEPHQFKDSQQWSVGTGSLLNGAVYHPGDIQFTQLSSTHQDASTDVQRRRNFSKRFSHYLQLHWIV